jgi:PITH domain
LSPAAVKADRRLLTVESCRYVKFQAVNHLAIFIEDNQGDEEVTRVGKIQLLGAAGQTMNVAEIKKVEEGH